MGMAEYIDDVATDYLVDSDTRKPSELENDWEEFLDTIRK